MPYARTERTFSVLATVVVAASLVVAPLVSAGAAAAPPAEPVPATETSDWVDGDWKCGDAGVAQTREVVTSEHGVDDAGEPTALSSLTTETRNRPFTQDEIAHVQGLRVQGRGARVVPADLQQVGQEGLEPL